MILPFEILLQIAQLVPLKDLSACISVCQAWKDPFKQVLWRTISVNTQRFRYLQRYPENHHLIQALYIRLGPDAKPGTLTYIQNQLGSLKRMTLSIATDISSFDMGIRWTTLRWLTFRMPEMSACHPTRTLVRLVKGLPCLERLECSSSVMLTIRSFSISDLEKIHAYAPKLKHLAVTLSLDILSTKALEILENIESSNLEILDISILSGDLRWFVYFARKYSHLHTLRLVTSHFSSIQTTFLSETITMMTSLPTVFPLLRNVCVIGNDEAAEGMRCSLWRLCRNFKIPVKRLMNVIGSDHDNPRLSEETLEECLAVCGPTIERLVIPSTTLANNPSHFPIILSQCTSLVDLRLVDLHSNPCYGSISLHSLLDNCPLLKRLVVQVPPLMEFDKNRNQNQHGLQDLVIACIKTTTELLHHISLRCRNLRYLHLKDLILTGPLINGCMECDMSQINLSVLRINGASFYEDCDRLKQRRINLCYITCPEPIWYHRYLVVKNGYSSGAIRNLADTEADQVLSYHTSPYSHPDKLRDRNSSLDFVSQRDWHQDIPIGYVKFHFGSVSRINMTSPMHGDSLEDPEISIVGTMEADIFTRSMSIC
ncbi:hypothetical protein J3Q64DRAFT_1836070 [Phycomyces blakesleeanus]|uniref:F-box domain-containing protein n=2 Tax=Phycomyces blakesleeanus TaxID=4837 RepID=A0A162U616_PHYB8|nr:hypothetical protein PHYBLDRAFT_145193 [Phycomyces blakesleeanus NRRL 1555(-)]OAD73722.1 hypothetical protein PHYBLDRAFT_145193 [Phycomyces blakesleeanus NRRL 1555(-)]|eukprot:XP_018291762.1 hypothetical protein PHYBLDRAFT_145193 [Phycomyces blakesleeanus NRRL 1555(-)]